LRLNKKSALERLTTKKDSFQFYLTKGHAYSIFRIPRILSGVNGEKYVFLNEKVCIFKHVEWKKD
jgi:hypothetical protein